MAWRSLRSRWFAALGSVVAIALGAALVTGAMILQQSSSAATPGGVSTPWQLRDVEVVVRMPNEATDGKGRTILLTDRRRLTDAQLATIRATAGVAAVTAETPSPAYVVVDGRKIGDAEKRSWAHPWSTAVVEPFALAQGRPPNQADELVLDRSTAEEAGVGVGDRVTLSTTRGASTYRLTGVGDWPGSQFEHAVFVADRQAAQLGGDPLLALVDVTGDPAAVARNLRRSLPEAEVTLDRAHALFLDRRQAELSGGSGQFMAVMATSALSIAALVIASTLSVSVMQRRREIALLRTVGATPGRIRRLVIGEAAFMGLVAGTAGAVAGVGLGAVAIRFFAAQGMVSRSTELVVGLTPLVVSVGVALVTAVLAGSLPAWKASRVAPAEAMRAVDVQPAQSGRARVIWGVLMLTVAAGFVTAGAVTARTGGFTAVDVAGVLFLMSAPFLVLAAVLLGRALLAGILAVVRPLLARSFGGFLATRQIRSDLSRAVGVTTPLMLMVAFACLLIFQEEGTFEARARNYERQLRIDLAVRGSEQLGLPSELAGRVSELDGVRAATGMINTRIGLPDGAMSVTSLDVVAVDPATVPTLFALEAHAGDWSAFGDDGIAVERGIAEAQGWQAGEKAKVLLPDGTPSQATVATVFEADSATFSVFVPRSMVLGHMLEPYDAGVLVALEPGAEQAAVAARIDALRTVDPDVRALTKAEYMSFLRAQSSGDTWIIYLFVILIGGYAGIAAINVLVTSAMARRGQFALLRLAGAQPGHVVRAVVWETAIIVLGGLLLGTAVAAVPLLGYGYIFTHTLWLPFAAGQYALICAAALLIGVVGGVVPARLVLRARALDALNAP
ncbi:FtsX-like permease family protein [Micromonospora sp. NPDC047074]|uniref:ABC transporter permease n=1 Tax=Micromonospora sp. NPDC047074 TaxID=3154339 RepID=UPI003410EEDE